MSAGQVLGGKYRLVRPLGKGGVAGVWLAEHLTLHSPVALRTIDPSDDEDALARFMREARAAASLRSPHVVQILDYGVDEGVPFLVLELLDGESLEQRLSRRERLSVDEVTRIVKHLARAIGRAHDLGIVHGELAPANVFIVPNDDEEIVKVLDFGVARSSSARALPSERPLDQRADVWSIGVIAYECLLGSAPFTGHERAGVAAAVGSLPLPSSVGPVPVGFDAWFARACAPVPEDRFASTRQLAEALVRVCEGSLPAQPDPSRRTQLGIAPMQHGPLERAVPAARPRASRPLVDDEAPRGFFASLLQHKLELALGAIVAFAAAATLRSAQRPSEPERAARALEPGAPAAPSTAAAAAPPLVPEPEAFSGLGRRVGPVPASAKLVLATALAPTPKPAATSDASTKSAAPSSAPKATTTSASAPPALRAPARARASETRDEPAPDAEATSCDPPYFIDAAGIRRVKPRCL